MSVTIVGLGPGSMEGLSLGAYRELRSGKKIFCRTKQHPVISVLEEEGIEFEFLDEYYSLDSFEKVYEKIADLIVERSKEEELIYCVPGHPYVAEKTVEIIEQKLEEKGEKAVVVSSMSFVDAIFHSLGFDPSKGFSLVNAVDFDHERIDSGQNLIVTQVYDSWTASEVKLKLMEVYEDETSAWIVEGAMIPGHEKKKELALYELDQKGWEFNHLTSLFVPAQEEKKFRDFYDLGRIVATLRGENGCQWDKKQTHESLKSCLLEEAEEVNQAVDNEDIDNLIEELGDVLLIVFMQSQIGKEDGFFDIRDVVDTICSKLIRRHPHVFGDVVINTEEEALELWNKIKMQEKLGKSR
ncbi:MAG: MazG nucleotide pyrophosphohydrolase domain-containing protein [Filifactor alocis]|nr:MazG nucleotide pyrophosphohydrolase domain-containing protein [Filifactor alocis]